MSTRELRAPHLAHTKRLAQLQERLKFPGRPVPGLTAHQAKGGEWQVVGLRLRPDEQAALAAGLDSAQDLHRMTYVACTRARTHRRAHTPTDTCIPSAQAAKGPREHHLNAIRARSARHRTLGHGDHGASVRLNRRSIVVRRPEAWWCFVSPRPRRQMKSPPQWMTRSYPRSRARGRVGARPCTDLPHFCARPP